MTNPCQGHAAESARAEHMNEAERLLNDFALLVQMNVAGLASMAQLAEVRAALLAHIQRGAVPDGWQLVPEIASDVMQRTFLAQRGTHTEFTHTALQCADFDSRYAAMLAAAPAPDHFRDAAKMMAAPAEVPMPEPDYRGPAEAGTYFNGYAHTTMRTYGDAREAAGYARGRAEAGRDAERYRTVRFLATAERDPLPEYAGDTSSPDAFDASIDHATAALRGEVKP